MESLKRQRHHVSVTKWLVFAASCIVPLLDFALLFTFGAMFVHLLEEYGDSRARTALVHSLFMGTSLLCGLLSGLLVKRFGVTMVSSVGTVLMSTGFVVSSFAKSVLIPVLFIGVVSGMGSSFIFVSSTVVVGRLFKGKVRETALAFHSFSPSFGLAGYPYIIEGLVVKYGVRGTFLLIGGILLNNVVITILFYLSERRNSSSVLRYLNVRLAKTNKQISNITNKRGNASEIPEQPVTSFGEREENIFSKFETISKTLATFLHLRYICLVIATALVGSSCGGLLVVLLDLLAWKGLSPGAHIYCLTAFHVGNAVARLGTLVITKVRPETALAFVLIMYTFFGISSHLILLFSIDEKWIIVACVLLGMSIGGVIAEMTVAVASFVNKDHFGPAFGLQLSVLGAMNLVFGPVYGYIRDTIQSYEVAIILTAALYGVAAILYLGTLCAPHERREIEDSGTTTGTTTVPVISRQVVNNRIEPT